MVTGGLVVVIFVVIAALMISKKLPTVLALPLMAVLIAIYFMTQFNVGSYNLSEY